MKRKEIIVLAVIICIALVFRIYHSLNLPLADHHSSHQASTISIASNYFMTGINLLYPQHNDSFNYGLNKPNPQSLYLYEFPLYSAIISVLHSMYSNFSLVFYARLVSILSSLIVIAILFYLTLTFYGFREAVIASLIYAVFPFFVFFSRIALSDSFALSLFMISMLNMYFFSKVKRNTILKITYIITLLFFSTAVLIKPAFLLFLPVLLYLYYQKYGLRFLKKFHLYLFLIITIIPLVLWNLHTSRYPEGIPFSYFLYQDHRNISFWAYIIPGRDFYTHFLIEKFITTMLGGLGIIFFAQSFFVKAKHNIYHWLLASMILYLIVFSHKHSDYEYYQTIILPVVAMGIGIGTMHIVRSKDTWNKALLTIICTISISLSLYISTQYSRPFYEVSRNNLQIADVIRTITQLNDKVITDTNGNTTLLFLSFRRGATSIYQPIPELKENGYDYIVTSHDDTIDKLNKTADVQSIFRNDKVTVFRL